MLTTFPQCSFSLEFPEILGQNHICHQTECVRNFQNNALWDIHSHALLMHALISLTNLVGFISMNISHFVIHVYYISYLVLIVSNNQSK